MNLSEQQKRLGTIKLIVPNLRARFGAQLAPFTDNQVASVYEDFSQSDEHGNNDEKWPEWIALCADVEPAAIFYVRTCQECGHENAALDPSTYKGDNWRDMKCRRCESRGLDYGTMRRVGGPAEAPEAAAESVGNPTRNLTLDDIACEEILGPVLQHIDGLITADEMRDAILRGIDECRHNIAAAPETPVEML